MTDGPTGMKTNGIGKRVDWLNRTRSMADDRDMLAIRRESRVARGQRAVAAEYASAGAGYPAFAGDDRTSK